MDNRGTYYEPPEYGVIINSRTAEKLHVQEGSAIDIQCPGISVEPVEVPVCQVIDESFGNSCYMSMEGIGEAFPTEIPANTVLLKAEPGKKADLKEQVRETSRVTWLVDTEKIVGSYRDMMQSMIAMIYMFAVLSAAAGGILIYNISMINIRERITEFGTLMILGEPDSAIDYLVFFEQLIYFAAGILMGIPGSFGVKLLIEKLVMSNNYSVHMDIRPLSYLTAFIICMFITILAWKAETGFIKKIHLTEILKERE